MKSELINVRPDARKESNGCNGTLEREEWRDVVGYEGLYQVSSFGRVRSLDRVINNEEFNYSFLVKGQLRKLKLSRTGYPTVSLWIHGKPQHSQVHRLVAQAFLPNPDNLPQVNHRNEDKTANYPDNLEWCDAKYNNNYGTKTQRAASKNKGQKRTDVTRKKISQQKKAFLQAHPEFRTAKSEQMKRFYENNPEAKARQREYTRKQMRAIIQLDKSGNFIREWDSASGAGRTLGINISTIANCCAGRGRIKSYKGFIWKYKSDYEAGKQ